jgi:hypothetical protein
MTMIASGRNVPTEAHNTPVGRIRSSVDASRDTDSTGAARPMLPLLEQTPDRVILDVQQLHAGSSIRFELAGHQLLATKFATGEIEFYLLG